MEELIVKMDGKDSEKLKLFETVKAQAKLQPSPYSFVKKWFLDNYKDAIDKALAVEEKKTEKPTLKLVEA